MPIFLRSVGTRKSKKNVGGDNMHRYMYIRQTRWGREDTIWYRGSTISRKRPSRGNNVIDGNIYIHKLTQMTCTKPIHHSRGNRHSSHQRSVYKRKRAIRTTTILKCMTKSCLNRSTRYRCLRTVSNEYAQYVQRISTFSNALDAIRRR